MISRLIPALNLAKIEGVALALDLLEVIDELRAKLEAANLA